MTSVVGEARAACTDRLDLVDAAFLRPGGPKAQVLRERYCPFCPVGDACLALAMFQREDGVWGGTSPHLRTAHGAPPADPYRRRPSSVQQHQQETA